jgi:hypothetical protein
MLFIRKLALNYELPEHVFYYAKYKNSNPDKRTNDSIKLKFE